MTNISVEVSQMAANNVIGVTNLLPGTSIGMTHFLILSTILFAISIMGIFLNRKNIIVVLMSIELMLLAVNFNFITFSSFLHSIDGQIFVLFTLTVAAAEAAIGLAILILLFRNLKSINVQDMNSLQG